MAKQTQITIPLTQFSVGTQGPFASGNLPSTLAGYQIDFQNDSTWPASGDVIKVTIEQSNDAGQTWAFDASITLAGGQWFSDRAKTIPTNTASWAVQLDNQGSLHRRIRATLNVLQACTLGATISTV